MPGAAGWLSTTVMLLGLVEIAFPVMLGDVGQSVVIEVSSRCPNDGSSFASNEAQLAHRKVPGATGLLRKTYRVLKLSPKRL